ncbi:hypothetical protein [Sphingomonas sp. So64.6b]|nr:hypothetical protein [Sphingomonas sp. So64.6b]
MPSRRVPRRNKGISMTDILWLGALAGLVALTLAYVRLCDEA